MSATNLDYRIVILTTGSSWTPGSAITSKEIMFSTIPGSGCYINSNGVDVAIDADGQNIDVMQGTYEIGSYSVEIVDAKISSTVNAFTQYIADPLGRVQLLTLQAFIQRSINAGVTWTTEQSGFVTSVKRINGIRYSLSIGETTNVEKNFLPFANISGSAPYRGFSCFLGGPIKVSDITNINSAASYTFGPVKDYGPIICKVIRNTTTYTDDTGNTINTITIQPHNGWYPDDNGRFLNQDSMHKGRSDYIRKLIQPSLIPFQTKLVVPGTPKGAPVGYYSGIECEVYDRTTKKLQHTLLLTQDPNITSGPLNPTSTTQTLNQNGITVSWDTTLATIPAINDDVLIYGYFNSATTTNPLHVQANPVDIITNYWTFIGVPFDTTAAAQVRSLYNSYVVQLYITDSTQTLLDFLTPLFALFGINFYIDDNGNRSLFSTIINTGTMPNTTITPNNVVDADSDNTFWEIEEGSIVNKITADQMVFYAWVATDDNSEQPVDGLVVAKQTHSFIAPQVGNYGLQEKTFSLPGHLIEIGTAPTLPGDPSFPKIVYQDANWDKFVNAFGYEMSQRFLRGAIYTELNLIGVTGSLGQEYILNLPQMLPVPQLGNTPVTQLSGDACVQMVQRTKTPFGMRCKFLSSGLNAQPLTSPQFTLKANPIDSRKLIDALITNSASLNSLNYDVAVQYTIGTPTGSGGNSYILQNYAVVGINIPATSSIAVPYGATLNVRMQSRDPGSNKRPGVWTAWSSLKATDLLPPNTLTSSGSTTNLLLKFHPGETDLPTEVWVYPNGSILASASFEIMLPPSSSQTWLSLDPTTGYTASLRHVAVAPVFATSSWASLNISSSFLPYSVPAPDNPRAFVGELDSTTGTISTVDGTYGLQVHANAIPSNTTLFVSIETNSGSGVFISSSAVVNVVSKASGFTTLTVDTPAPHDGKRRQLKAQSSRIGMTASLFTPLVTINPWIGQNPTDYPVPVPADLMFSQVVLGDPNALSSYIVSSFTQPTASQYSNMQYKVRAQRIGDTGFSPFATVAGNAFGPDLIPAQPNTYVGIIATTVTAGGTLSASLESFVTMSDWIKAEPTFTFASSSQAVTYNWVYDMTTQYMEIWSEQYPTSASAAIVKTVENIGAAERTFYKTEGTLTYSIPLLYSTNWVVSTIVPYDSFSKRGTARTVYTAGVPQASTASGSGAVTGSSGGSSFTDATGVVSITSITPTTLVFRTLIGTGVAGDHISFFSPSFAGVALGTVTAGDVTNGFIDSTLTFSPALSPGFSFLVQTYYGPSTGGTGGPLNAGANATVPSTTIPTPSFTIGSYDTSTNSFTIAITPAAGTPTGVTWHELVELTNPPTNDYGTTLTTTDSIPWAQTSVQQTVFVRIFGRKTAWTDSANSSVRSITVPKSSGPL